MKGNLLKRWEDSNGIQHRAKINPPDTATFPNANSFLDLCIADNRLLINNLKNGKVPTSNYNSNHKAILININPVNKVHTLDLSSNCRFMYKKIKWSVFTNKLKDNYNTSVPHNVNLANTEIDQYI
ncbi:hypothetical protein M0804_010197 [Polistes exclamans]|nr:hypothetical protein M0804_010197 [Polistes exclamans]